MSGDRAALGPLPVVPFMKFPVGGAPYLEGSVCSRCDAVFVGRRAICARCGARDEMKTKPLSNRGTLHAYTIVHRSFPGVRVPYVSAVVDLDGGGSIKGNLVDVEPSPEHIAFGMALDVVYADALGRKDADGNSYVSYFFRPRSLSTRGAS